jgi:hypothetical protein
MFLAGVLAVLASVGVAPTAFALRIAMPGNLSLQQKLLTADAIVVGKVTAIEKETVDLEQYANGPKVAHTVAVVKLENALVGAKNVTHIKVVFVKPGEQPQQPEAPPGRLRPLPAPIRPGFGPVMLTENQEGVFFLTKHPASGTYYQINAGHLPLNSSDGNYKEELTKVAAAAKAFTDPIKALSSDQLEERIQSALSLAYRYRMYPTNNQTGVVQEEAIPAEESKLMMKVLLDSDWAKTDAHKLADALGLLPGQYGIPDIRPAEGEDANAVRQKAFKDWYSKYGTKYQVKKVHSKMKSGK